MFPDMWSRGITALVLCVTVVSGALAALPGPAGAGPGRDPGEQGLMRALEQAPMAVAAWKHAQDHHAPAAPGPRSKRWVKSRFDPFRMLVFARSLTHGHLGDPPGHR